MDFSRLKTLRELSLRKTMAAVAQALFVSPSAISQQISLLEEEVGVALIERRGRGVSLTAAGERLVEHTNQMILIMETAKTDLAELSDIVSGELRIAAFPSVAALLVPKAMVAVCEAHPRLKPRLYEMEPVDGLAALKAWQIDVALIDDLTVLDDSFKESVEIVSLLQDKLYALLPPNHPLAKGTEVRIATLKNENLALDTALSMFSHIIARECKKAGFDPQVNGYCDSFDVVLALVEAGCSIAMLPGLRVLNYHGKAVVRLLKPEIRREIFVAYRRGELRNPAISAFVNQMQANVAVYKAS